MNICSSVRPARLPTRRSARRRSRGFSLVEILVALIVSSIGLLGLAKMEALALASTDVAGTRWDYNLIGFRGEEEIGFHAGSAVAVGAMQLVTGAIA